MSTISYLWHKHIKAKAKHFYLHNEPLRATICGKDVFPWTIPLRSPGAREVLNDFQTVRAWARDLEEHSKERTGIGYSLEYSEIKHRQLGSQRIPIRAVFSCAADFLAFLGKKSEHERRLQLAKSSGDRLPSLLPLLAENPALLVDNEKDWEQLLRVCEYFFSHPRPGLYHRALDIPGVDTKFIENNRKTLSTLLDRILPASAVDSSIKSLSNGGFESKYGLLTESPRIRFRSLCEELRIFFHGITDFQIPVSEFATLALPACNTVFITENKMNGLAFPPFPSAVVVFALGHAVDLLYHASWLSEKQLVYWGDLDTHGFFILSRLRQHFPHVQSMLMDQQVLLRNKSLWVQEGPSKQYGGPLENLTVGEKEVFEGLRDARWGERVRLEQERIPFSELEAELAAFR